MEKKTNYFSVAALVAFLAPFVLSFFNLGLDATIIVALVSAIATIVFSIIAITYAKKIEKGKALPIVLLVLSILGAILFGITLVFLNIAKDPEKTGDLCKQVVSCEKEENNVSKCYLKDDSTKVLPIKCYTSNLTSDQFE